MTRTVAIIQARMGSSRLPGKVLVDLAGRLVLDRVVTAAQAIAGVDEVMVATSETDADAPVAAWCLTAGLRVHRGPEHDVLARFAGAAAAADADIILRITADCPFLDPAVAGQVLALLRRSGAGYASNFDPRSWPDGLDCEAMRRPVLDAAAREATRDYDREHVTPYIRANRARFAVESLICPIPHLADERWTLDTADDLARLRAIAARLPGHQEAGFTAAYVDMLAAADAEAGCCDAPSRAQIGTRGNEARYTTSEALLERAERTIPLGSQTFSKSRIQYPSGAAPLFLDHGDGGRVWDVDGNEYVDLVSGLLPIVLGYRDPDVDTAIRHQLNAGITFSLASELEAELAERLVRMVPCAEMVRFGKNGSDATSAAVRLARAATGRERLLMCGYHGWQDWYIGATPRHLGVPEAVRALSTMVAFNDLDAIEDQFKAHPDAIAAVILEPASAEEPRPGYLEGLRALTREYGALLVFDEVITGCRWGLGGAQAHYGVTPDLSAFGKAMGNGMPISAIVGRADIMRRMEDIFFSATFGGEALSLAAAIATLDKLESHAVPEQLWSYGGSLKAAATSLIADAGLDDVIALRGAAPWAILAYQPRGTTGAPAIKTLFLREMIAAGVLINASHNVCYAHNDADRVQVLAAYERALATVSAALRADDVMARIGGKPIEPVFTVRKSQ
jgi:glutamate-1-semialdehyde 2,1-aminomutase